MVANQHQSVQSHVFRDIFPTTTMRVSLAWEKRCIVSGIKRYACTLCTHAKFNQLPGNLCMVGIQLVAQSVAETDKIRMTAIHVALGDGRIDLATLLVERGASLAARDNVFDRVVGDSCFAGAFSISLPFSPSTQAVQFGGTGMGTRAGGGEEGRGDERVTHGWGDSWSIRRRR